MNDTNTTVEIPIGGMTCASCVGRNERALGKVDGVSDVSVNIATERARITYDPARVDLKDLTGTIEGVGYDVPTQEGSTGRSPSYPKLTSTSGA